MIEVKTLTGGLNLDDGLYRMPPNDYVDALNITKDAVEGSNDNIVTPIVANRILDASFVLPSGTNKTIGSYANTLRNTIIQFNWNSNGFHQVLEGNLTTRIITKLLENLTDSNGVDILGFTQYGLITSINIYNREEGDLLFFLDSLGRPTEMDIELFRTGEYIPVTRVIIDKAKQPPLLAPSSVYDNDTTIRSNNLRNKLFRFSYRWIYDDFEKSTFSPISIVPLPVSVLTDTYTNVITNNNVIQLVANTGDKNVKSIELAMSFVDRTNDWSDFESVTILEKSELGLKESSTHTAGTGGFDYEITLFSGAPSAGDIVNVYLTALPNTETLIGTYTVIAGDTVTDIATGLAANILSTAIAVNSFSYNGQVIYFWDNTVYEFDRVEIINVNPDNDNIDFPFSFYNDSTYPVIPVEEGPIVQLFDYVPLKANAQEMPNGNILAYIGITEGYNKDTTENATITVGTIAATGTAPIGNVSAVLTSLPDTGFDVNYSVALNGIPATGTVINFKIKERGGPTVFIAGTYTTVAGDTVNNIITNLVFSINIDRTRSGNTINIAISSVVYAPFTTGQSDYLVVEIIPPGSSGNSIPTWKWSTGRSISRAYFDVHGVTNGVLYADKVTFPAYAEDGSSNPLIPYINYLINDIPPIWAHSFGFYMTKENTQYKFWESIFVDKNEAEYIYFEVTNFVINAAKKPTTAAVCSYTFKDGDRMRVIRDTDSPGIVFDYTYDAAVEGLVIDPVINSVPMTGGRQFIKIKNIAPFTSGINSAKNYVIELFTPGQQEANKDNQVYYEFGQNYDIIDAELSTRRHSGMVTDQVVGVTPAEFNFYDGDAYFRSRTIANSNSGYATFNIMDRNFVDFYISAVSSVDGRPNIIDINARQAYYSTLIRHGEAYQANTNINGLNRFYEKNFDEYDYSFGDALRLVVKNRQLVVCQKYKIGNVPLYSSIGKDPNGLTVVFNTDKLLNPIRYYDGDFGIGTCPESIASFNYAVYGCDNIKGIIWRLSLDGLIALSQKYKVNSWANDNLPLRTGNHKTLGAFDQRLNNYIIAAEEVLCVGVEVPDFTINEATANELFNQKVQLTGSLPFTLANVVKPTWMAITISGYNLIISGTPSDSDIGTGIPVTFDVSNDCGTVSVDQTIDVVTPPCVAVSIVGSPILPDGALDTPYSYSFETVGSTPISLTGVTKPSWMSIDVTGNTISFSGTPDSSGTDIPVNFTIENCSIDTVLFSDLIDITPENWFISYTNNDNTVALSVYIGNNNSSPSTLLYTGTYSTDPLKGTDIVNLPAVNLNCNLFVPGKTIVAASCNGVAGTGLGSSTIIFTGINGGPLIVSFITS